MSKPSSLRYPRDRVKQGEKLLRIKLHKVVGDVMNGVITKIEGRDKGFTIIDEHYKSQIQTINAFIKAKGLVGLTGFEGLTWNALEEAKNRWRRIIEDIQLEEA